MKKKVILLLLSTVAFHCMGQTKQKIKWKDFLGTWYSKDVLDKEKGKINLEFDKKSDVVKADSLTQTSWRFFEGDSLHFVKNYSTKPTDIVRLQWYYVKASNTLLIRQKVNMGAYFMTKDLNFSILEMKEGKLKVKLMEK